MLQKPEQIEIPVKEPYYAYKAFNEDFTCLSEKFAVGGEYIKPAPDGRELKLCSKDGWHYCDTLEQTFLHYSRHSSRFCKIEVLGKVTRDTNKAITNHFRIIEEVTSAVKKIIFNEIMSVEPYYQELFFDKKDDDLIISDEPEDPEYETNDFNHKYYINNVGIDVRIDPNQRYTYIEFDGFNYRVAPFETIMAAKFKYAIQGNKKHKQDVREICGFNPGLKENKQTENDPFEKCDIPF